jgi:hypothetical protein
MLFADYTMTNTFFFEYLFLLDVVPEPPISIYYGFVKHICKIFRPKKLQIVNVSLLDTLSDQVLSQFQKL